MDHRIETRAAFHVTGLQRRFVPGPLASAAIPKLWGIFAPIMDTIAGCRGTHSVGVCEIIEPSTAPTAGAEAGASPFRYTAGVETGADDPIPDGMVRVAVPGGRFAVFTHRGPISTFGETIAEIWLRAIPAAGLKPTGAPDFELYDERFDSPSGE